MRRRWKRCLPEIGSEWRHGPTTRRHERLVVTSSMKNRIKYAVVSLKYDGSGEMQTEYWFRLVDQGDLVRLETGLARAARRLKER